MQRGYDVNKGYSIEYVTELLKIANYVPESEKHATDKDYLEIAVEACQKFNEEFEGTFDSL